MLGRHLNMISKREIGMLVWQTVLWNFMKVRWQVQVWPAPEWWCCLCPGAASWPPLSEDAPDPRAPEAASPPCHPATAPGHSGKYYNMLENISFWYSTMHPGLQISIVIDACCQWLLSDYWILEHLNLLTCIKYFISMRQEMFCDVVLWEKVYL